jgi:membrane protein
MLKFGSASSTRMMTTSRYQRLANDPWRARPTDDWYAPETIWTRIFRIPRWMYRGFTEKNAGDLAAAVAYHALVALVPMFLLLVTIGGLFLQSDTVLFRAEETIRTVFGSGAVAVAFQDALDARNNSGLFGLFSFLGFAWAGTGFVSSLARSMNAVYGVRNASYVNEKQRGFIVIIIFSIFFIISSASSIITTFFVNQDLPTMLDEWWFATVENQIVGYAIAYASAVLLFVVIYRVVPNAGQRLVDIWPGSLIAAVLFSITTQAFPIYIRLLGGANRYGVALGLVSLIVAAVYILAHIMLFGAYVNAGYLRRKRQRSRAEAIRARAAKLASSRDGSSATPD